MPKKTISSHRLESTVHTLGKNVQDVSMLPQKRFDAVDRRFTEVTDDIGRMVKQWFDEIFVDLEARVTTLERQNRIKRA